MAKKKPVKIRRNVKPFRFNYPIASYQMISDIRETHSRKELLAEYNRMRSEALKRMTELKAGGYADSQQYLQNLGRFRGGSKMNKTELAYAMRDAAKFLTAQMSTVRGMREYEQKSIDTWRNTYGYEFINRNNIRRWGEFLNWYLSENQDPYKIDDVAQQFRDIEKYRKMTDKQKQKAREETKDLFRRFELYQQGKEDYAEMTRRAKGKRISSADLAKWGY